MVRRCMLFSPGDQDAMLRKAPTAGADVVVFDLEDAVTPGRKQNARETVRAVLTDPSFDPDCEVCVRVNPTGIAADDDLEAILAPEARLDSVMLPKVDGPNAIRTLADLLEEHGRQLPIIAIIETARGVLNASEIADAEPTDALVFGAEDLAADTGATRTKDGTEVLVARQEVVLAASAADVDAIDTIQSDFEDTDRLAADAEFAAQLGYDGKLAIHPAQVDPINDAFTPAAEEIEWAQRVLAARDRQAGQESGVFSVDGEMIDQPLLTQAERIIERAEAADRL
ncbi:MAG: CoA ester lyase [Halobacteriales archaeon]